VKIKSILELYEAISEEERLITDVLRQIIKDHSPNYIKEKISFNVPFFYGHRGIAIVWPASIPRGGISKGVLLGFWNGYKLVDEDQTLTKGTNKKVFYKIYTRVEQIEQAAIQKLLSKAIQYDQQIKT
jgi:hypothetical protein